MNVVATVFNVTPQQILDGSEKRGAREAAIYLTRKYLSSCFLPDLEQAFHADRETIIMKSFSCEYLKNINFKEELAFATEEVRRMQFGNRIYPRVELNGEMA